MEISKKELKLLLDQIDEYDEAYYNENKKIVSDEEYDGLKDKLASITFSPKNKADEKIANRIKDALTRIGAPPPKDGKWPKVKHDVGMASLNKVNLPNELIDWAQKDCNTNYNFFVTEKLDGLSVSLKYENGKFIQGSTRGDGITGENITRNVKKMKGVPNTLSSNFTGYIRGEIVLLHSDHKKHFPEMANPRNGASGIAKRIDGIGAEHLTVISYTVYGADNLKFENEAMDYIASLGFITPKSYFCPTTKEVNDLWQKYMDETRNTLDYDIDGLVVRIDNLADQFALGDKGRGPKGAVAYKFETPEAKTIIKNIVCQVGDTGQITPVAEFNPVFLLGAEVKRASLHNFSNITTLGVTIGSEVFVKRANDVIPFISKAVIKDPKPFPPPANCPSCNTKTEWKGEYLVCPNKKDCPPQVIGRLNKWIGELNILEWGEKVLQKLIDSNLVKDVADLYKLTVKDLSGLDRMGEKSAQNLINELDKFREIRLENFIGGLCIDNVATSTVKFIIDAGYDSYDKIKSLSVAELENIPGFGNIKAEAFFHGLKENEQRIQDIFNAGVTIREKTVGVLTGKSFCFTGKSTLPRAKLQSLVEENGGSVKSSVGKGLDFLVLADPSSTSSKAKAAQKHGTKLLSEEEFMKMI